MLSSLSEVGVQAAKSRGPSVIGLPIMIANSNYKAIAVFIVGLWAGWCTLCGVNDISAGGYIEK